MKAVNPGVRHRAAIRHLKRADARLAAVMEKVGPCTMEVRSDGSHLDALIRAIVYQQLSGKAAATIHSRVLELFGGADVQPQTILGVTDEAYRAAGLSRQKISYLRDLAEKSRTGDVLLDELDNLPDAEIAASLTSVKGIGIWTVQMFLIFRLGRPDVLPVGDLGIQKGVQRAYGLRKLPTPKRVAEIGASWTPHASVASWYIWRLLDEPAGAAKSARKQA